MPVRYANLLRGVSVLLALAAAPTQALKVGDSAPDFALAEVAGDTVALSSLQGRVVLLYFFGWD